MINEISRERISSERSISSKKSESSVVSYFMKSINEFSELIEKTDVESEKAISNASQTNIKSMHDTMLNMEEADVVMKYAVSIRNKIIDAYREISRMAG